MKNAMRLFLRVLCLFLALAAEPATAGGKQPIELTSGRLVTFERPGIYKFTKTDDTLLLLSFLTPSKLYDGKRPARAQEDQLNAETDEICRSYATPYLAKFSH